MSAPFRGEHDDRVVSFVAMFCQQHGYGPTFRECAEDAGLSVASVQPIIARLVHQGRLAQVPRSPRTLSLPKRKVST